MTEEYTKLKTVLQQTDGIVEEMRKERDVLRAQVCSSNMVLIQIVEGMGRDVLETERLVASCEQRYCLYCAAL